MNVITGFDVNDYAPTRFLPDEFGARITRARWCLWRFPSLKPSQFAKSKEWCVALALHFTRHDGEEVHEPIFYGGPSCDTAYPVNLVDDTTPVLPEVLKPDNTIAYLASHNEWWPEGTTEDNVRDKIIEFAVATEGTHLAGGDGELKLPPGSKLHQFVNTLCQAGIQIGPSSDLDGMDVKFKKVNATSDKGKPFHVIESKIVAPNVTVSAPTTTPVAPAPVVATSALPTTAAPALSPEADAFMLQLVANDTGNGVTKQEALKVLQSLEGAIAVKLAMFQQGFSVGAGTGWRAEGDKLYLAL